MPSFTPLEEAFLEDHRCMTRGLVSLRAALEQGDWEKAVSAAEELDRGVGPHIRFEEEFLYPLLVEHLGRDVVRRLYQEHHTGQELVRALRDRARVDILSQERELLVERLTATLQHAEACGKLLSHVHSLDPDVQDELLKKLQSCRARAVRWTELPATRPTSA